MFGFKTPFCIACQWRLLATAGSSDSALLLTSTHLTSYYIIIIIIIIIIMTDGAIAVATKGKYPTDIASR